MNKRQWIALGFMFMIFAMLQSFFQDVVYEYLTWVCIMAWAACWICGLLEKEEAR
ncbi:MAG: hypothetical protein KAT65_23775 [Methanophagales archaeon]|nr:hypothetical protein [Methanophagales archaeon]